MSELKICMDLRSMARKVMYIVMLLLSDWIKRQLLLAFH